MNLGALSAILAILAILATVGGALWDYLNKEQRREQFQQETARRMMMNLWDRMRAESSAYGLCKAIEERITTGVMGPKVIGRDLDRCVTLRRERLQYVAEISPYVDETRDGFEVRVPAVRFHARITWERGVVPAAWDELSALLCKVDRSIIKGRNSRAQPLTCVATIAPNPTTKVEILGGAAPGVPALTA